MTTPSAIRKERPGPGTPGRARMVLGAAALVSLALASFTPQAAAQAPAAPDSCYATLGNTAAVPGALIRINRVNGQGTLIGPTGIMSAGGDSGAPALAIKSTGEMYAMETGPNARLYRVDAATGAATVVASTSLSNPPAIAFDGQDRLWAADITGALFLLDAATGATMFQAATGVSIRGLAFDPTDGALWASDAVSQIFTIDPGSGVATLKGNTGQFASPDLEFDPSGNLFASSGGGVSANKWLQISKTTGVGTVVGSIGFSSVAGMAARLTRPALCPASPLAVAYVDASATGGATGASWTDAYTELRHALSAARCGSIAEIWVAEGTYTPGATRTATFQLRSGLGIYGGFAGTETSREQRDWLAHPTILSGDIGAPADSSDNSFHVVNGQLTDSTAVLDGFTITRGNALGAAISQGGAIYLLGSGSPTLAHLVLSRNTATWGGAIVCNGSAVDVRPRLRDVVFTDNDCSGTGGAIACFNGARPDLANVVFWRNRAFNGGAMSSWDGSAPIVTNASFANNVATNGGGALYNQNLANPSLVNTVMWGNTAPSFSQVMNVTGSVPSFSHSLVQGSGGSGAWVAALGTDGGGNLDADPLFLNASAGDVHLSAGSPAIDAGDTAALPADVTTDLNGVFRVFGAAVDMGAYESGPAFVKWDATGSGDGRSWANAYTDLQVALTAFDAGGFSEIWVAEGTYRPTAIGFRDRSFALRSGLGIYGGFAGTETTRAQRDWVAHPTILSGDIGVPADSSDNSFHVVAGQFTDSTAVLDGFTVTRGNAVGAPLPQGGGIYLFDVGSPTLTHLVVLSNTATWGGGMVCNGPAPAVRPRLRDVVFADNDCSETGGAMACFNGARPDLANVVFWRNRGNVGGAVANWDGSNPILANATFANNVATAEGGALYNQLANPSIANTVIWGNSAPSFSQVSSVGGSVPIFTHSLVQGSGGSSSWDVSLGTDGGGNLDADPLFVDAAAGDLHLSDGSPAIDAGDSTLVTDLVTDLDGLDRVLGAQIDMGAYERAPAPVLSTDTGAHPPAGPFGIALGRPHPIPARHLVHVPFDLQRRQAVRLAIYDLHGRLVKGLVDGVREPGRHVVGWEALDQRGERVPAGIYFLSLRSEGWSAQRTVVVVE